MAKSHARTNQAQVATSLPTLEQTQHLACTLVLGTLRSAVEDAVHADHWCDEFHDSVCAAEMVEATLKRLQAALPGNPDDFDHYWWSAHSVTKLAAAGFPKKDCAAWRALNRAVREFETMHSAVDTIAIHERKQRAEADDS